MIFTCSVEHLLLNFIQNYFTLLVNTCVSQAFQQEISLNMGKMESVFGQGEVLMEKSEPLDAAVIEEELDELQRYCREVFGRVERYYQKLTRLPVRHNFRHACTLVCFSFCFACVKVALTFMLPLIRS